jgi:hypothetical protein
VAALERLLSEERAKGIRLETALTEAGEQQAATSEILRVISSSPTDEQPVFEAIVENARRLCDATYSVVFLDEGGMLKLAAVRGVGRGGHRGAPPRVSAASRPRHDVGTRDSRPAPGAPRRLDARPRVHASTSCSSM